MNITKLGHCCFVIEERGVRIITDPGIYSEGHSSVRDIDAVLITHEHADHLHLDALRPLLVNNPNAHVITNAGVGKILDDEQIPYRLVEDRGETMVSEIVIRGIGAAHALIYPTVPSVVNTGYLINNRLFYPGDALTEPGVPVEILALPVAGPWLTLSDSINYALRVHPRVFFPVHDGMLKQFGLYHRVPAEALTASGIAFAALENHTTAEL